MRKLGTILPLLGLLAVSAAATSGTAEAQTLTTRTNGGEFYPYQWGTVYPGAYPLEYYNDLASFPLKDPIRTHSNGYFADAEYAANCATGMYVINVAPTPASGYAEFATPARPGFTVPLCSAVKVPVVDASFLGRLDAAGLAHFVVFPIKDNGNGRGYVVWHSKEFEPYWQDDSPRRAPLVSGYARIEGVAWQDQFKSYTPPSTPIMAGGNLLGWTTPVTQPHGDAAGGFIASLPSPKRETTLRLEHPAAVSYTSGNFRGFAVTMVQDDWLAGTPTPPTPPTPLTPPAPPPQAALANPTNAGSPSMGSSSGEPGDGAEAEQNGAAFDWNAYCYTPNPDGSARTLGWIENCLATKH